MDSFTATKWVYLTLRKLPKASRLSRLPFWSVLKVSLAVCLFWLVISQTSLADLVAAARRIQPVWLLVTVLAFALIAWAMARRYWVLVGKELAFHEMLELVIIQTLITNFLMNAAGATSFVALLRTQHQIGIGRGVLALFLARVGDIVFLASALAVMSWPVWSRIEVLHNLVAVMILVQVAFLLGSCSAYAARARLSEWIQGIRERYGIDENGLAGRTTGSVLSLCKTEESQLRPLIAPLLGYSAVVLVANFAYAYATLALFAFPLGLWDVLFVAVVMQLVSFVPVQVFGGLGIYEVSSVYLYSLLGAEPSETIPIVIGAHAVFYLLNAMMLLFIAGGTLLHCASNRAV